MLAVAFVDRVVWVIASAICLLGAIGVVFFRNAVHNALSLIATLFGVAVLFVAQGAYFLAVIQVVVYAGAIVVLFLFVIMLLGVDRAEEPVVERKLWRQPLAVIVTAGVAALVLVAALVATSRVTGERSVVGSLDEGNDIAVLGRALFTRYVYVFEITSVLLTIAVVGAVVLARRSTEAPIDLDELPPADEFDQVEDEPDAVDQPAVDHQAVDQPAGDVPR